MISYGKKLQQCRVMLICRFGGGLQIQDTNSEITGCWLWIENTDEGVKDTTV